MLAVSDLKPRTLRILSMLIEQSHPVTTGVLADHFGVTQRSIRYDLDEIEQVCADVGVTLVRRRNGVRLEGDNQAKARLAEVVCSGRALVSKTHASEQRLHRLLAILLFQDEPVLVKQLEDVLKASPRTVYMDMDRAETWLDNAGLKLIRKRHYGAKVEGPELLRRHAALRLIRENASPDSLNKPGPIQVRHIDELILSCLADMRRITNVLSATDTTTRPPRVNCEEFIVVVAIQLARMKVHGFTSFTKSQLKQLVDTEEYAKARENFRIAQPAAVDREMNKLLKNIAPYLVATIDGGLRTGSDNPHQGRERRLTE
ncbi:HTH domain-containing protein [Alicyclobacillus cycloheptanicus]|uniref:Chromosome segregation and condensation protein ScpB n=1 Tax=Alicyclobacillus cycloheptanicus TaxID=1457 RepID=A0ABT9XHW0_9BACL|nr:HTH domain-containing protein [Alicyclobacillus cycloheptanicus]MDQ0189891.1 chromosome segregation and condensation protein ScpB [Alicyclobacillus cycloheptanicus]WDM02205.1 HTH domain-containing protein [Alicyclobacillus cycloheptanicus]